MKLKKIKNWFNTHHNQISIYKHYPNRKRISKITGRLGWISLIISFLYLVLLSSLYPSSDPNSTTNIIDKITPLESFLLSLIFLIAIILIFIYAFTTTYNKAINRFPLKSTRPLSDNQKNDVIDTLSELLKEE